MSERIVGVVVTHRRREQLAQSLKVLSTQTRPLDHLVVVDNADEAAVRELVESCPLPTSYLGSRHN
ncbi:MAG: galactofuranosyl transferase, partial [Rhodococcus sp. (in: high G+C Gram-positive bacteria)]|nr:galactofuranosyl transferase [Rhodococcus sp. (in: high G+C Gram-positive bacteria)]MDX5455683.1 galactofuranosyl transferase [Rhodococcus sp. (in: high G+C Gram-positive bacteria)]